MKLRFSAAFLSLLIFTLSFTACKEPNKGNTGTTGANTVVQDDRNNPELDIMDLDGYTFNIYGLGPNEGGDWHVHDILTPEAPEDAIDDAVYKRNGYLEDTYNFSFGLNESSVAGTYSEISTLLLAGEEAYDDYCVNPYDAALLAGDGLLLDFNELPYLALENDYWSPSLVSPMSVNGKLYAIIGDISIVQKEGVRAFYFNKTIAKDKQLPDIYQLVYDQKWTYDEFFRLASLGSDDLNGDGKIDAADRYGVQGQSLLGMVLYQGSGDSVISKDQDDQFVIGCDSDRAVDAIQKITNYLSEQSTDVYMSYDWKDMLNRFDTGKALFYTEVMLHIKTMRGYDVDFGIIPTPKYDEQQEGYHHFISGGEMYFHTLPALSDDPERSAYILEVTAVASKYYVTPAFYEISLQTKWTRDEESKDMLDIIFSTYRVDLGNVYGFGRLYDYVFESIIQGGNISQIIGALKKSTETSIGDTLDHFAANTLS